VIKFRLQFPAKAAENVHVVSLEASERLHAINAAENNLESTIKVAQEIVSLRFPSRVKAAASRKTGLRRRSGASNFISSHVCLIHRQIFG